MAGWGSTHPPLKTDTSLWTVSKSLIQIFLLVMLVIALLVLFAGRFISYSTRSKTSRAKSDMRSMATAIEAYFVDNNEYPAMAVGEEGAKSLEEFRNAGHKDEEVEKLLSPGLIALFYNINEEK